MKQTITPEQLNELTPESKDKLADAFEWKDGINWTLVMGSSNQTTYLPLLSIGQMLEFLGDDWHDFVIKSVEDCGDVQIPYLADELCDALWEAVKHELSGVGE